MQGVTAVRRPCLGRRVSGTEGPTAVPLADHFEGSLGPPELPTGGAERVKPRCVWGATQKRENQKHSGHGGLRSAFTSPSRTRHSQDGTAQRKTALHPADGHGRKPERPRTVDTHTQRHVDRAVGHMSSHAKGTCTM